jgi:hypothetical protein
MKFKEINVNNPEDYHNFSIIRATDESETKSEIIKKIAATGDFDFTYNATMGLKDVDISNFLKGNTNLTYGNIVVFISNPQDPN